MKIEIPTSPQVADKIKKLFDDNVLRPQNMTLLGVQELSNDQVIVHIDWQHGEIRDVFFLGYWTNHKSELK